MNVNIDFTKNNIKVGYINENISTTLDIAIPDEMADGLYKYRVVFQVHRFEQYKSDFVELDDNNHIIYEIPSTVTIKPTMDMQVVAYDENNGMVRKSKTVTLVFDKSVIGKEFIVDPFRNQVKVAELTWDTYNKTNMSSKKLIEYVKQGFFITVQDNIVEVYDINEEENFIIFYHLAVMDGRITGIAFFTIRNDVIDIVINNSVFDMQDDIEANTEARHTHDNKESLDKISENGLNEFLFNGETYYNANEVEQAIASAEGDLIEIAKSSTGWTSRFIPSELVALGRASKGFSLLGTPVLNWRYDNAHNRFYFQYIVINNDNICSLVTAFVDNMKNVIWDYSYNKYFLTTVNNISTSNGNSITLHADDIVATAEYTPQTDDAIATKKYVDENAGGNVTWDSIQDKPQFSTVATSGDYNDLENLPNLSEKQDALPNGTNVGDVVYWDGTGFAVGGISNVVTDADNIQY